VARNRVAQPAQIPLISGPKGKRRRRAPRRRSAGRARIPARFSRSRRRPWGFSRDRTIALLTSGN